MERKREDCDGGEECLLVVGAGCCPNSCLCIPCGDYKSLSGGSSSCCFHLRECPMHNDNLIQ